MAKDGSLKLHKEHGKGPEAMLHRPYSGAWLRVTKGQNELFML